MKVLIYGFKPYGHYETNITEQILTQAQFCPWATKKVFNVEFDYDMFSKAFNDVDPHIILGLGQHPRARKLRNERKAKNTYKTQQGEFRAIAETGPIARFASLDLPGSDTLTTTYDAGDYVCNFSMYLASEYCDKRSARFGFIHVPRTFPVSYAVNYLNRSLDKVLADR
jgi:pyrrolidone-carboxylate peptidase